ncbi:hypothetical protein SH1V18_16710 [Vallitalea longa]|uniref:Phage tail sheath protein n=1 Tax=Vallitalea longa TaxID=2936439 RepID=A0A9W6DDP2_9FIRM|nr:phage tail sheath family protein [Vallitalea longa]GKX29191.1 hypothetical protein SH1V18_16710 [Vallitalea longa]
MAGGSWTTQNKVRPGAYINFESNTGSFGTMGDRGIVTMPMVMSWGAKKQVMELEPTNNFQEILGYSLLDDELLLIKEAFKCASKILLYRVNGGSKATKTVENLTATAKYEGVRGNDITVRISEDINAKGEFIVTTYLDKSVVYEQTASSIDSLKSNPYVDFTGTGALSESAGIVLEGGSDTTPVTQDYMDYFTAIEVFDFNTMALPVDDDTIKSTAVSFIKRLRNDEGKKIQAVLSDYTSADYEGIISVKNGVKLADGTVIDKVKATAYVAGITAGADVNVSNTYKSYAGAVDVDTKYTNSQIVKALNAGEIVFVANGEKVVIEQDINTLTSFSSEKDKSFRKNRVIRVLDSIANDIQKIFSNYYIGKVTNDDDGRNLFKSEVVNYMKTLQGINAIQNFNSDKDIIVQAANEKDSIIVDAYIQPTDSMEKLYMKVTLN